jgi:response regulator of citrate/malate metabolism
MKRPGISLLFVEDDTIVRDILCSFINAHYTSVPVYAAGTAEEGLKLFKKSRQSIVMTDINLTGSDGISMARSIRSIAPDTVIIFVTGSSKTGICSEFEKGGPCHIIIKPVVYDDLFGLLDRYIYAGKG